MRTLTCASLAGGQGKTTVAVFTARLLAKAGHPTLLIDADPQASSTMFIGHRVESSSPTLLEVLKGSVDVADGIYKTEFSNLYVIPADMGLNNAQDYLATSGIGALLLRHTLEPVAKTFKFCIIDAPPQRSQLCLTSIGAADALVLPMEATTKGVASLLGTMDLLQDLRRTKVFSGQLLGVLPFRDKWIGRNRTKQSSRNIEAMAEVVGEPLVLPTIRESEQYKEALNQKMTPGELGYEDLDYPFNVLASKLTELAANEQLVELLR